MSHQPTTTPNTFFSIQISIFELLHKQLVTEYGNGKTLPILISLSCQVGKMADWGPVLIGVVLFVLLQPGLLFQLPGNGKQVEFGSMRTNGKAIAVHTLIFFTIYSILILAVHVHIYTG